MEKVIQLLNEAFLPENIECDGGSCMGCWKDKVREAIKLLSLPSINEVSKEQIIEEFYLCMPFKDVKLTSCAENPELIEKMERLSAKQCYDVYLKALSLLPSAGSAKEDDFSNMDEDEFLSMDERIIKGIGDERNALKKEVGRLTKELESLREKLKTVNECWTNEIKLRGENLVQIDNIKKQLCTNCIERIVKY
jgi:flagellar motility protein MotE (MotC chaperone)